MFDAPAFAQGTVIGSGDVRAVSYGEDKGLFVEFYSEPQYMEFQSLAAGRAMYRDINMVKIYVPGDKTKVVAREVRMQPDQGAPADPDRWPAQWHAFQNGKKMELTGTPLSEWPKITRQQVNEFNAFNIYTVEQLSEVPDAQLDGLGHGSRTLRDGAKAWLARAGDDAAVSKMEASHAAAMADMQAQIEALRASVGEQKRGPGRPPKEQVHGVQE